VALAWLLTRDGVDSIILGASNLQQLEDNLGASKLQLTAAELSELDESTQLLPVYPNWFTDRIAVDQTLVNALHGSPG
jgi:aryl-alcohol dehydrogenase-like predicted oxidoreductase